MEVPESLSVGREGRRRMEQGQSRGVFSTGVMRSEVSCFVSIFFRMSIEREPLLKQRRTNEPINLFHGCDGTDQQLVVRQQVQLFVLFLLLSIRLSTALPW